MSVGHIPSFIWTCLQFIMLILFRVAKHYNSPRSHTKEDLHKLYDVLKNAKFFEADKISCVQIVEQDGKEYLYEISSGYTHIEDSGSNLKIFVPKDKKRQAICFAHALPARLFEWITADPSAQLSNVVNDRGHLIIKDILREDPYIFSETLSKEGIVNIDITDAHTSCSDDGDTTSVKSMGREASVDSIETDSIMATPPTETPSSMLDFDQEEIAAGQRVVSTSSSFTVSRNAERPFTRRISLASSTGNIAAPLSTKGEISWANHKYPNLLNQAVSAARNASFPTKSVFDLDALRAVLPSVSSSDTALDETGEPESSFTRDFPPMERDKMIGAAGELYVRFHEHSICKYMKFLFTNFFFQVFELLKSCNLSLPNFGIANWKSRIRSYARQHPEYATMEAWRGIETSDLVYNDTMGAFTKLLIDKCYLEASVWQHRRPTYYFEVKTTVGPCETRFFISKKQYKMVCTLQSPVSHQSLGTNLVLLVAR